MKKTKLSTLTKFVILTFSSLAFWDFRGYSYYLHHRHPQFTSVFRFTLKWNWTLVFAPGLICLICSRGWAFTPVKWSKISEKRNSAVSPNSKREWSPKKLIYSTKNVIYWRLKPGSEIWGKLFELQLRFCSVLIRIVFEQFKLNQILIKM